MNNNKKKSIAEETFFRFLEYKLQKQNVQFLTIWNLG